MNGNNAPYGGGGWGQGNGAQGQDDMMRFSNEVSLGLAATPSWRCTAPKGARADRADTEACQISSMLDDIRVFESNIGQVTDLHSKRLATTSENAQNQLTDQLQRVTQETSLLTNSIRNRINYHKDTLRQSHEDADWNTKKQQILMVQNKFKRTLEAYQQSEADNRRKYRDRIERQVKIGTCSSHCCMLGASLTRSLQSSPMRPTKRFVLRSRRATAARSSPKL